MKRFLSVIFPQSIKNLYHLFRAVIAAISFGFPGRNLRVIGVTGTNGKTTTSKLIARILEAAGYTVAVATTIDFQIGEKKWVNTSKFTTRSAWQLQKFLRDARKAGCDVAVLETSSHALDQHRTFGIPYEVAVITNVTREHLDYHQTMESYRNAKKKLFQGAKNAVINLDMENPKEFSLPPKETELFYSVKDPRADLFAKNISLDFKGTEWMVGDTAFSLRLPGLFNVENALAALAVAKVFQIDFSVAKKALAEVTGIPGRMELVENGFGGDIVVDFALTPDAFEKLYASVLPLKIPGTKIIHVFGSCGERDRGKRPILGEIASKNADVVILTNDEPYYEDPERIIDEIERGVQKKRDNFYRIPDRREAIVQALKLAQIGDIVLVTGMGAEDSIAIGGKHIPWNDRQVIEEELASLGKK